jgi:hypothetical protein
MSGWLCVVVNDLQEVMFTVFKNHENAFVLQDDLDKVDQVGVVKLGA